jgi:hypothetical protein
MMQLLKLGRPRLRDSRIFASSDKSYLDIRRSQYVPPHVSGFSATRLTALAN